MVTSRDIDASIEEMRLSSKTQAVRNATLHERIFLCAVLLELRRTGLAETSFAEVIDL